MRQDVTCALAATALSAMSAAAVADGLDTSVLTEGAVLRQISQLATVSGSTASGAYSFAPEWSEELGFSATGALGYSLQEGLALGLIVTAGERKREALLNFGFEIGAERQVVLSGGQLQEKLAFGPVGARQWVKQNEFGLAYETANYALSVYHVDSENTDNFVGAKSTGAELSGSIDLSEAWTMGFSAGYQTLDWDDDTKSDDGLTANIDLGYQVNANTRFNVFADHNISENQFGLGGSWDIGAGTLDATYTRIDGRVGAITDDNRLAVALTMPLGRKSNATVSRSATDGLSVGATSSSTLLSDVMTRPSYLPQRVIVRAQRVIVRAAENSCTVSNATEAFYIPLTDTLFDVVGGGAIVPDGVYDVSWVIAGRTPQPSVEIASSRGTFPDRAWPIADFYQAGAVHPTFLINGIGGCFFLEVSETMFQ